MATKKKKDELWVDCRFNSYEATLGNGMRMIISWESKGYAVRIMDKNFPDRFQDLPAAKKFAEITAYNILQEGICILTKYGSQR